MSPADWGRYREIVRDAVRDALHDAGVVGRAGGAGHEGAPGESADGGKTLLSVAQAATALSCSERYVRELLARGILTRVYLGRAVRIRRSEIDALIAGGGVPEDDA